MVEVALLLGVEVVPLSVGQEEYLQFGYYSLPLVPFQTYYLLALMPAALYRSGYPGYQMQLSEGAPREVQIRISIHLVPICSSYFLTA